jgi:hypothetical protein
MFELLRGKRADAKRLNAIDAVMLGVGRGVFKRIDENRELLDLLQRENPELIERCFWIAGWLADQDRFLVALAEASQMVNPHSARNISAVQSFPRPWPGKPLQVVQKGDPHQFREIGATEDL